MKHAIIIAVLLLSGCANRPPPPLEAAATVPEAATISNAEVWQSLGEQYGGEGTVPEDPEQQP